MAASILIADDDPNIVRALSFLMRSEGHDVQTAVDGEQALAAIRAGSPDLLLLDVMMPRKNGYDVCRAVRAMPGGDAIRIVMLTARGREDDRRAGLDLGVDAYVTKPFAIADVTDCVRRLLPPARNAAALSAEG